MKYFSDWNMKQRIFILNALLCLVLSVWAVPAKRGVWCSLSLVDGTEVKAQLVGDEFLHYYVSEDGTKYVQDESTSLYRKMTDEVTAQRRAAVRRAQAQGRQKRMLRKAQASNVFQGTKKGLIILVQFTDSKFKSGHDLALYKRIANDANYSDNNFKGSIKDYFKAQSHGLFELDFDVAGICQLQHTYAYYGKNSNDNDVRAGQMVAEACLWAHKHGTDFSKYDWDGDGEVDQVFVLYAGHGEASYDKDPDTIWPHMHYLSASDYRKSLSLDGVTVDTYACSCELNGDGNLDGIGTFCHEFSHCMGFPDLYDTSSDGGWFGMGDFDLMCSGSYNGDSKCPAGYSAYEKAECGWLTLKDMTNIEQEISIVGVQPMSADGDAYIIKNKGHEDEYYILENRQKTGWDSYLPASGLMITHVDYDADIWDWNMPNTSGKYEDANGNTKTNDHQRLTIFRAGNSSSDYGDSSDLYPYRSNNTLTKTSSPAATLYNTNSNGSKYMHVAIKDIAIASDGTASFTLSKDVQEENPDTPVTPSGSTLLYESFDECDGTGGNDGIWGGRSIGAGTPTYDNKGWTSTQGKVYASSACVRVGTSSVNGDITTPSFTVNGKAVLSFKAGAWNTSGDGTTLNLSVSNGTISPSSVTMKKGEWTDYNVTITANGNVKTTFKASKLRFFLDEVKVTDASTSGIQEISASRSSSIVAYYTLGGVQVTAPSPGIYLARYADGTIKKVVIR